VSGGRLRVGLVVADGQRLRSARVFVNGRPRATLRGKALTRMVSLRGLARGAVTVKVVGVTRAGKRVTAQKRYKACAAKKR